MVVNRQDAYRLSPLRCFHLRRLVHIQNLLSVTAAQLASRLRQKQDLMHEEVAGRRGKFQTSTFLN